MLCLLEETPRRVSFLGMLPNIFLSHSYPKHHWVDRTRVWMYRRHLYHIPVTRYLSVLFVEVSARRVSLMGMFPDTFLSHISRAPSGRQDLCVVFIKWLRFCHWLHGLAYRFLWSGGRAYFSFVTDTQKKNKATTGEAHYRGSSSTLSCVWTTLAWPLPLHYLGPQKTSRSPVSAVLLLRSCGALHKK